MIRIIFPQKVVEDEVSITNILENDPINISLYSGRTKLSLLNDNGLLSNLNGNISSV